MSGLNLSDEHAQLGKIANNIEHHGDSEEVIGFGIPVTMMLAQPQLDEFMGRYFHRAVYNTDKTGLASPVDGFRRCKPLELEDTYEECNVRLAFPGDRVLEFAGCRVQKFVFELQVGGLTQTRCQVYLRPGLGAENLLLQEHQHREASVQITAGKLALKKNPKQEKLPLEQAAPAAKEGEREVSGGYKPGPGESGPEIDARMAARAASRSEQAA